MLHVIDIYSKYAWVVPLKDKKGISNTKAYQKNLNESNHCVAKSGGCKGEKMGR